jgi:ABC-type multidrug transport system permease subunit
MIDSILIEKSTTTSYLERGHWTELGLQAFFQSHFLGVGIGSIRTSNWFVNIIGSTGVVGSMMMFGFLIISFCASGYQSSVIDREWQRALKFLLTPMLAMDYFVGTTPDIGVMLAAILGLLAATRPISLEA